MKVAVIFITCNRSGLSLKVIRQNFFNSGYDAYIIWVDNGSNENDNRAVSSALHGLNKTAIMFPENKGISTALNAGIKYAVANGYDAVVTHANDILMPGGWLAKMVAVAGAIPLTGMCGIHCVEALPAAKEINGITVHPIFTAFGNALLPAKAIDSIGYFNEEYDPYGMQDADFAYRLNKSGFINYYLHGLKAEHIGHDVGNDSDYRKMKDTGLGKALAIWEKSVNKYAETNTFFVNHGDYLINMEQFSAKDIL